MKLPFLKNRKRIIAALLSGTALAAGGLVSYGNFFENPSAAPAGLSHTNSAGEQASPKSCIKADTPAAKVPEKIKPLWQNLQVMKNSKTVMGPPLASFAAREDISYCTADLPAGVAGLWLEYDNMVKIDPQEGDKALLFLYQVHETIHSIQGENEILNINPSSPLAEMQIFMLSYEAAARVGEDLLAIELAMKGRNNYQRKIGEYADEYGPAMRAYKNAVKHGKTHKQALAAAGRAGFKAQMKDQYWLDFYNNYLLSDFIGWVVNRELQKPVNSRTGLAVARESGWISPEFNFTAGLKKLPAYTSRFGGNRQMRQAFDYAELVRLGVTSGEDSPAYQKKLRRLKSEKNPYLGVSLKRVFNAFSSPGNKQGALELMTQQAQKTKAAGPRVF